MGWQAVGLAVTIVIRSYNNAGVPAADLAAARAHTEAVLEQAGLNVVWTDCWAGSRRQPAVEAPRCQEPVGGGSVGVELNRCTRRRVGDHDGGSTCAHADEGLAVDRRLGVGVGSCHDVERFGGSVAVDGERQRVANGAGLHHVAEI